MPSSHHHHRVKGKRISRPFIIGTEAWKFNDSNRPPTFKTGDTTCWRVYVRPVPGGPDISAWLKKVVFRLHEDFGKTGNVLRTVETSPFELEESGYGSFEIPIKLYFHPEAAEKPQDRKHTLRLEPYGDGPMRVEQDSTGCVRSESVEYIEFNEPTDLLWDALTSETQWSYLVSDIVTGGGKTRGGHAKATASKGKIKAPQAPPLARADLRHMEMPSSAPPGPGCVYSKDAEESLLEVLTIAVGKVDELLADVIKNSQQVNRETDEIKAETDVDAKLLHMHDKLMPPTKTVK